MGNCIDELQSQKLFDLSLIIDHRNLQEIGQTPSHTRVIAPLLGGTFAGPRLCGTVLPGGADWVMLRRDLTMLIDVRITLRTDDAALIYMHYTGIGRAADGDNTRLVRREAMAYPETYIRSTPHFETGAAAYAWLNSIVSIGNGMRTPEGAVYTIFEIL
jgi:hypothetical protein